MSYPFGQSTDDRRKAERRSGIETDDDERFARRVNISDRRVSPAVGEHAIQEYARLRTCITAAMAHLYSAKVQHIGSDDKIIADHIEAAYGILDAARMDSGFGEALELTRKAIEP